MNLAPMQVRYGDLLMGLGTPYAVDWDASGLLEMPSMRSSDTDRARGHGAWLGEDWATAQPIVLSLGMRRGRTRIPVEDAYRTLERYTPPRVQQDLWYQGKYMSEPLCLLGAVVRRRSLRPISIRDGVARGDIELFAPDPIRYGEPTPLTAVMGARPVMAGVNRGTATAWPEFRVHGPVSSPVMILHGETGRQVTFVAPVPAKRVAVIDQRHGLLTVAGMDHSASLTSRQWISLPPGPFTIHVSGQAGVRVDMVWRPAWL